MKIQYFLAFFLALFFLSCTDEEPSIDGCGEDAIMVESFLNIFSDDITVTSIEINGNCLSTTIEYQGGCDDDLVELELYVQEGFISGVSETIILMNLAFNDNDACLNTVSQQFDFNLSPLQSAGLSNKDVIVVDWVGTLYYEGI